MKNGLYLQANHRNLLPEEYLEHMMHLVHQNIVVPFHSFSSGNSHPSPALDSLNRTFHMSY